MSSKFDVKHRPDNEIDYDGQELIHAYIPLEMAQKLFNIQQSLTIEYEGTQFSHELKSAVLILLQQFIATALKFADKMYQEELLIIDKLNQLANRRMRRDEWSLIPIFITKQTDKFGIIVHWAKKETK